MLRTFVSSSSLKGVLLFSFSFQTTIFWGWILQAMLESVLLAILPLYFLTNSDPHDGVFHGFQEAGAVCFTAVIVICNFKVSAVYV